MIDHTKLSSRKEKLYPPLLETPLSKEKPKQSQMIACSILAIILFILGVFTLWGFLSSLIWGMIFAISLWPLYNRICFRYPTYCNGFVLPLTFTLAMLLMFVIPLTMVIVEAGREIQDVIYLAKVAQKQGIAIPDWLNQFPIARTFLIEWWENNLLNPEDVKSFLHYISTNHGIEARRVGGVVFHRSLVFLFTFITLFFLFRYSKELSHQCLIASRRLFGARGELIGEQIIASVHGTVTGLILVSIGEGILMGAAYAVVHAPHPALFGVLTSIGATIPFCAVIVIGFVSLLLLFNGHLIAAIAIFSLGMMMIFIADHFIRPVLIGGTTKLPFLWVLLGIIGGVENWGLLGLFLGPAIMSALYLLWQIWTHEQPTPK